MKKSLYDSAQVSTHSRPKAAAIEGMIEDGEEVRFNTQPPEGGC